MMLRLLFWLKEVTMVSLIPNFPLDTWYWFSLFLVVTWDSDSGDDVGRTFDEILKTFIDVSSQYPKPQLMISGEFTADAYISKVVPMLQEKGYKLVTGKFIDSSAFHSWGLDFIHFLKLIPLFSRWVSWSQSLSSYIYTWSSRWYLELWW